MKRIYLFGLAGAAVAALLVVILVLGFLVAPVRAQLGQAVDLALQGNPGAALQVLTQLKAEKGILVAGVFQDSPADKAGITRGDIILQFDGQVVNTNPELTSLLAKHKAGDAVKVLLQRGDTQKTVTVTLAQRPPETQATPQSGQPNNGATPPEVHPQSGPYLGILPIGAGEWKGGHFGFHHGEGRIIEVVAGSPAEKAGLKVGETIRAVDGQALGPQLDLAAAIAKHKPGDKVKLEVLDPSGASREVTVTLGENPDKKGEAWLGVRVGFMRFHKEGLAPGRSGDRDQMPFPRGLAPGLAGHPGALVQSVAPGSPAEKAGLKAGQLIQSIDGQAVNSPQAMSDLLAGHKPGDQVTLQVYDGQAAQARDVPVTLGENPQKAGAAYLGIEFTFLQIRPRPTTASGSQL